jgi:hypothetical protein
MKIDEVKWTANEPKLIPDAPLGVLVIYEDFPARLRIQHVYWMLMRELSDEFNFDCSWYGFQDLEIPRSAARASAAAANADLILFSVDLETELPPAVKSWIESWIGVKAAQDAALAALLNNVHRRNKRRMPIWKYLSGIAQRAGMSFLPEIIGRGQVCHAA